MKWTPKQIEKYKRQKYISFLEKVTKNLFRMFRNRDITTKEFIEKFSKLKLDLDNLNSINLNSHYHQKVKSYIDELYSNSQKNSFDLDNIREVNMTKLNRLQKIKNSNSYKKKKYKNINFE